MRDLLEVTTPENVVFEYELAGPPTRALAWVIDVVVMVTAVFVVGVTLSLVGLVFRGLATAFYFIAIFVIQWGYGTVFEWRMSGQTVGKRLVGLRVLSRRGTPIGFMQALVRNLVRAVDMLPSLYFVGGLSVLLDARCRRLGDLAGGTVVVRERHSPRPTAIAAPSERYNTFMENPIVTHAAQRITAPERNAMVSLSLRRDNLPLGVRHRLFERLSEHLQQRLGVVRPAFLSHERFVLNLASVALGLRDRERLGTKGALRHGAWAASDGRAPTETGGGG